MTINTYSKGLKAEVSFDLFGAADRQDRISKLSIKVKGTEFENKVRLFTLAPLAVADYEACLADPNVKRTAGEHADMMGVKAPMFSMMRGVVTVLRYGAGQARDGGWGDVKVSGESVETAWNRLVEYRNENRDPKDVVLPIGAAAAGIIGDDGESRWSGLVEFFESFPGGMSGVYNLMRGKNADGSTPKGDEGESGEDGSQGSEGEIEWTVKLAEALDRARRQGATDAEFVAEVMRLTTK